MCVCVCVWRVKVTRSRYQLLKLCIGFLLESNVAVHVYVDPMPFQPTQGPSHSHIESVLSVMDSGSLGPTAFSTRTLML